VPQSKPVFAVNLYPAMTVGGVCLHVQYVFTPSLVERELSQRVSVTLVSGCDNDGDVCQCGRLRQGDSLHINMIFYVLT
jgi:hypothetical protein